jgi:hypothetical protein
MPAEHQAYTQKVGIRSGKNHKGEILCIWVIVIPCSEVQIRSQNRHTETRAPTIGGDSEADDQSAAEQNEEQQEAEEGVDRVISICYSYKLLNLLLHV